MKTDTELRIRGFRALVEALGDVEAERFIALMLREPFDYTQWQKQLWVEKSVSDLSTSAMEFRRSALGKGGQPAD